MNIDFAKEIDRSTIVIKIWREGQGQWDVLVKGCVGRRMNQTPNKNDPLGVTENPCLN